MPEEAELLWVADQLFLDLDGREIEGNPPQYLSSGSNVILREL
jgi:hypothetical protein